MAKGRIGLSLSPDVIDILNKYGRSVDAPPDDKRPTRTRVIEDAIRCWAVLAEIPFTMDVILAQLKKDFAMVPQPAFRRPKKKAKKS